MGEKGKIQTRQDIKTSSVLEERCERSFDFSWFTELHWKGSLDSVGEGFLHIPSETCNVSAGLRSGEGAWLGKGVGFCCTTQQLSSTFARCILHMQAPFPGQCMSHRLLSCIHSLELVSPSLFQRNTQCSIELAEDSALTWEMLDTAQDLQHK